MTASFRFSTASEVQNESTPESDIVSFIKSTVDELEGIACHFVFSHLSTLIYVLNFALKKIIIIIINCILFKHYIIWLLNYGGDDNF